MNIYLSHSTSYDYENELYKPLKRLLINPDNVYFPHDKKNSGQKSKEIIMKCDLVIAEVSYPSTGQGIELGWADLNNVPILCLYKTGSKLSQALHYITDDFVEYSSIEEVIDRLESKIHHFHMQ